MDKTRRVLVAFSGLTISASLFGCATSRLFENRNYVETVSSVLITQDRSKLVFIGNDYHYIFDAPKVVVETLSSSFHSYVSANIGYFSVLSDGSVSGDFKLNIDRPQSEEIRNEAISAGFLQNKDGSLRYHGTLRGTRFTSNNIKVTSESQRLNKAYNVNINAEQTTSEKAMKSLLTPITVAADGVLILAAAPLAAIWFIGFYSVCRSNGCK